MIPAPTSPALAGARSTSVNFGSAHLLVDGMPLRTARRLLEAAVQAGCARLDTAPLYGHGGSELLVASIAAERSNAIGVTTKVGLEPVAPPSRLRRCAGRLVRRLPAPLVAALRQRHPAQAAALQTQTRSGRFEIDRVKQSIERSLSRLGPLDRLLLHEVHLPDITDDLLDVLSAYRRRGDVSALGIATGDDVTPAALDASHGVFTVAHISADPAATLWRHAGLRPGVQFVGHGVLGAGGSTLGRLMARLASDPALASRWRAATAGTAFGGEEGAGCALLALAARQFPGELLVATSRLERVPLTIAAAAGGFALGDDLAAVIGELLDAPGRGGSASP